MEQFHGQHVGSALRLDELALDLVVALWTAPRPERYVVVTVRRLSAAEVVFYDDKSGWELKLIPAADGTLHDANGALVHVHRYTGPFPV